MNSFSPGIFGSLSSQFDPGQLWTIIRNFPNLVSVGTQLKMDKDQQDFEGEMLGSEMHIT